MKPHLQQEHLVCSSFESLRTDIELAHAALDALGRDSAVSGIALGDPKVLTE